MSVESRRSRSFVVVVGDDEETSIGFESFVLGSVVFVVDVEGD